MASAPTDIKAYLTALFRLWQQELTTTWYVAVPTPIVICLAYYVTQLSKTDHKKWDDLAHNLGIAAVVIPVFWLLLAVVFASFKAWRAERQDANATKALLIKQTPEFFVNIEVVGFAYSISDMTQPLCTPTSCIIGLLVAATNRGAQAEIHAWSVYAEVDGSLQQATRVNPYPDGVLRPKGSSQIVLLSDSLYGKNAYRRLLGPGQSQSGALMVRFEAPRTSVNLESLFVTIKDSFNNVYQSPAPEKILLG